MADPTLHLGEPADEADWRALVEQGLKGAQWSRLVGQTADGIALQPLYREPDFHSATDVSGMPGAAPFVRGAREGAWLIRQSFAHPDPERTNTEILADLAGGVGAIELVLDPDEMRGLAAGGPRELDRVLADVILEAAPVSLDAGEYGVWAADLLRSKLKGVATRGTAFNLDPILSLVRFGALDEEGNDDSFEFVARHRAELPAAKFLRVDARPAHEAGGTQAQEIAAALSCGIHYMRALTTRGLSPSEAAATISFAVAVETDVLVESAKLRALRLCWARVLEASGVEAADRAAYIHAFTSRRMMTCYDAWTNILRVTTAAFAAGVGGANEVTTYALTDAIGLPTAFGRRVARNTQLVLLEECRLGHVADPAGGAWFVEKLTRDLADKAWAIMQAMETKGGIVAALSDGWLQSQVSAARGAREKLIATRRETITGVTDFPLLGAELPASISRDNYRPSQSETLPPMRWAAPFETLRARAEGRAPAVFFANIATLAEFGPRAQWVRNLFASGGVGSIGPEDSHATMEALIDAFRETRARVAVIASTDACYADHAENCAQRLKAAGADWVVLAGKPGENEARWRKAGVDQFVFAGQDALAELRTLHVALGIGP